MGAGAQAGSGSGDPPPPPKPPPPPPLHTSKSLWDPIGDPGKLRAAASAWRDLATALDGTASGVRSDAATLTAAWQGGASEAFGGWASRLAGELTSAAGECRGMAGQLDDIAGYLDAKNTQIHHLYEAIAAAAVVGIGFSIITFGFSDAAAAGAGAALAAEAGTEVAEAGTFLSSAAGIVSQFASRFAVYLGMWGKGLLFSAAATEAVKVAVDHKPFDWSFDDAASVVDGATGFAAVPGGVMAARPFLGGAAAAGGAQALTSTILNGGDPLSMTVLEQTLLAAGTGGALSKVWTVAHGSVFASPGQDPVELPGSAGDHGLPTISIPGEGDVGRSLGVVEAPAPGAIQPASPVPGYHWDQGLLIPDPPGGAVRSPSGVYHAPGDPIPPGTTPLYVVRYPTPRGSLPSQVAGSVGSVLKGAAAPDGVTIVEVGAPPTHDVQVNLPGIGEVTLDPGRALRSGTSPDAPPSETGQPAVVGSVIEVIWPAKQPDLGTLPPVVVEISPPPPLPGP